LTSLLDLEGKKIAVKQGDIHFRALKGMIDNFNLKARFLETDEYETVFEMIDSRYADVAVVNRLYGDRNKKSFGILETPVIFNPIEMRYGAAEGKHEEILNTIDTYLMRFKQDENSTYNRSINRWFVVDSEQGGIPGWLVYVMYIVAGASLLLFGATVLFRYQVKKRTQELTNTNAQLESQIEERLRAEDELSKFARVVEASSDAMALIDTKHNHVLTNTVYREMVVGTRADSVGKSIPELFGVEYYQEVLDQSVNRCLQGEIVRLQITPRSTHHDNRHWDVTLSPYYSRHDEINGYVLDIRDVTQEVELQERLRNAQKMEAIGLLAGGVAHDLNNILSGLVSYPDMLLVNRSSEDPMTMPLQTIKKSGERAAAIVQDLLTLARRGIGQFTPLNLNKIISEFCDSPEHLEIMRGNEGIDIELDLDEELFNIRGSEAHLGKILMNLCSNSVEAMPDGGFISVATENRFLEEEYIGFEAIPAGEYVVLHVIDSGIGMGSEELGRIFEPFYTSKVMGRSGTGLGMAVVWGAVKDHSGFTEVESRPDKGTKFSIYFPITRELLPEEERLDLNTLGGSGQKILVVDDMAEQRQIATQILELLGYQVEAATSGEEAVEMCRYKKFDLLILDMIMPGGMDGFATYKQICQAQPGQKAVIASGYSDTLHVRKAQELGAGAYIKKPYTVTNLAKTIATEMTHT
jgi:PAS domain S-box-containing protein